VGSATSGRRAGDGKWIEAVQRAIKRRMDDDPQALEKLADNLLNFAASSISSEALPALKELGDRLDGKAKQQMTISGDADTPLQVTINRFGKGPASG
jgi:hypothetical protein